jgi:hypothetical protein
VGYGTQLYMHSEGTCQVYRTHTHPHTPPPTPPPPCPPPPSPPVLNAHNQPGVHQGVIAVVRVRRQPFPHGLDTHGVRVSIDAAVPAQHVVAPGVTSLHNGGEAVVGRHEAGGEQAHVPARGGGGRYTVSVWGDSTGEGSMAVGVHATRACLGRHRCGRVPVGKEESK